MSQTEAVGVLIVTHQSERVLPGLLESLPAAIADVPTRVVIVDNASTDRTVDLARASSAASAVVALERNLGFAAGVNRGLSELRHGELLLLNPDTRLPARAVATLAASLRAAPDDRVAGIVSPRIVDATGRLQPSLRHEPSIGRALAETLIGVRIAGRLGWSETILERSAYERRTEADWASGAALMLSRAALRACGPWDQSFFLYSEDADYALRARDLGYPTRLAPECTVVHIGGDSRDDPGLWSMLVTNKVALFGKRHGRARAGLFRRAALLRELRFAATGNVPSRAAARALRRPRRRR